MRAGHFTLSRPGLTASSQTLTPAAASALDGDDGGGGVVELVLAEQRQLDLVAAAGRAQAEGLRSEPTLSRRRLQTSATSVSGEPFSARDLADHLGGGLALRRHDRGAARRR